VVWDGVVGERGWVFVFLSFFLLWYGDLMKIFFQENIIYILGMENFQHKNLIFKLKF
jgi:hypothetical protein